MNSTPCFLCCCGHLQSLARAPLLTRTQGVFIRLPAHLLTRHKACFHLSCTNARLRFHSRPQARFHAFAAPRGAAACSIQNPHQRVTASSPECSRLGGETPGKSNKSIQNPERSEWVAEAEDSRFPMNGRTGFPWALSGKRNPARTGQDEIHASHGRYPRLARTKSAGGACRRRSPETFSVSGLH